MYRSGVSLFVLGVLKTSQQKDEREFNALHQVAEHGMQPKQVVEERVCENVGAETVKTVCAEKP